jgi:Arc/MetJ-type ribon-helix-helix transcriptional regulator
MAYEFPTDIRDRLKARLEEGEYASEDEVIRDAMDALDQVELDRLTRWNERNQLAAKQSSQGLSRPLDDQRVLARLRERLASEGIIG